VTIDVVSEISIDLPRDEVASFASDPDNATQWYENIKAVEWRTAKPIAVGSQVAFVARFLRRRIAYTYEVVEFLPAERLLMRTTDGPFPMETSYDWRDGPGGSTAMTLRNRGEPAGFAKVTGPLMATAVKRANRKDLRLLKRILERSATSRTSPWGDRSFGL
jgi:hypothetical protein